MNRDDMYDPTDPEDLILQEANLVEIRKAAAETATTGRFMMFRFDEEGNPETLQVFDKLTMTEQMGLMYYMGLRLQCMKNMFAEMYGNDDFMEDDL